MCALIPPKSTRTPTPPAQMGDGDTGGKWQQGDVHSAPNGRGGHQSRAFSIAPRIRGRYGPEIKKWRPGDVIINPLAGLRVDDVDISPKTK